jgi:hypothetical protein
MKKPLVSLLVIAVLHPAGALAAKTRQVYVTIDTKNEDVELQRLAGVAHGYVGQYQATVVSMERICKAPCRELVDVTDVSDYYVAGAGVVGDGHVDLFGHGDSVNIKVEGGSRGRRIGGFVALLGGGAAFLTGGLLALVGAAMGSPSYSYGYPSYSSGPNTLVVMGVPTLVIGLLAAVAGVCLLPGSGSDISVENGATHHRGAGSTTSM